MKPLLLLSFFILPTLADKCLSLKDSQACPGFSNDYISQNATTRFSWFPKDDVAAFDRALNNYIIGQSNLDEFQAVFRCPGLDSLGGFNSDHGSAVVRYHRSMICADILFSEENIQECYGTQHKKREEKADPEHQLAEIIAAAATTSFAGNQPQPLCKSTCMDWINSLKTIVTNTTLCPHREGNDRLESLDTLKQKCQMPPYSGSPGHCVSGNENEPRTCGYQRVEDWCKYCSYSNKYVSACASVGVNVKDKPHKPNSVFDDDNDPGDMPLFPTPPTSKNPPLTPQTLASLKRDAQQEHAFRVATIVLGTTLGLVLVGLLVAAVTAYRRQKEMAVTSNQPKDSSDKAGEKIKADFVDCFVANVGKPRRVVRHFFARRDDEISLQQGDLVTLQMAFDDGWVVGKNLTTGGEGTFPLMCVLEDLPPSVPAQWSVLPESKNASSENLGRPSQSATNNRMSPRQSSIVAIGHDGNRSSGQTTVNAINGSASRLSNLSATVNPPIAANVPMSPGRNSTRDLNGSQFRPNNNEPETSMLRRLLGAFSPSNEHRSSMEEGPGLFKRLLHKPKLSPAGIGSDDFSGHKSISAPKPPGRPHSFNINHVVHIGLDNPHFPRVGETLESSFPSLPSHGPPSLNGYPVITRPPAENRGMEEYANNDGSLDTYQTAEQTN